LPDRMALEAIAIIVVSLWLLASWLFALTLDGLLVSRRLSRLERRLLFAAMFLIDPTLRLLFLNGLETGLVVVLFLLVMWRYVSRPTADPFENRWSAAMFGL